MRSAEQPGFILEFDVAVVSRSEIPEDDAVSKLFSTFADQEGVNMVICPLSQTVQVAEEKAYNKAISDAIEVVNSCDTNEPGEGHIFDKIDQKLKELIKTSQPNQ